MKKKEVPNPTALEVCHCHNNSAVVKLEWAACKATEISPWELLQRPSSHASSFKVLEGCCKVSPGSLLQAEQPHPCQSAFRAEELQPCHHFCGPSLDLLQLSMNKS